MNGKRRNRNNGMMEGWKNGNRNNGTIELGKMLLTHYSNVP